MKADDLLKLSQTTLEEILDLESKSSLHHVSNPILTAPYDNSNDTSERNLKRKEMGFGGTDGTVFEINSSNGSPDVMGRHSSKSNSKINRNGNSSSSSSKGKGKKRKISVNHSINSVDDGREEGERDEEGGHLFDEEEDDEDDYMSEEEDSIDDFRGSAHKGRGRGSSSPSRNKSKQSESAIIGTSNLSITQNQGSNGMTIAENGVANNSSNNSNNNSNDNSNNKSNNNSNNKSNNIISSSSSTLLLDLGTNSSDKPYGGQGEHGEESQLEYLEESFQLIALMVRGNAARIKDDMK